MLKNLVVAGTGLGNSIRNWVAGLTAFVFFMSAPEITPNWWTRLVLVAVLFGVIWLGLFGIWQWWRPSRDDEVRFGRASAGVLAGLLFFWAFTITQGTSHLQCTQAVETRDGTECVGDYVRVGGPDTTAVFMTAVAGATAFWVAVANSPWKETKAP